MKLSAILASAALLLGAGLLGSCSKGPDFTGTWTSLAPDDITADLPGASTAGSLMSIQFTENAENSRNGSVVLSSILDITQPVQGTQAAIDRPYEASVAATASVGGTWMYNGDDNDELLLSFDLSSLEVNVDKNGVTFTQDMLTGSQQPQIDSLTNVTANLWKQEISRALRSRLTAFSKLDDVEVNRDGILSFEIKVNNHDKELHFRRSN